VIRGLRIPALSGPYKESNHFMFWGNHSSHWAAAGALAACILLSLGCKTGRSAAKGGAPPPSAIEVAVVTVRSERVVLTTELPGRTSAYLVAEIRPQVNGLIQSRHFQEGAHVKAGDLLYQIDPTPYQAAYNQAKAALAAAEADLVTAEANLPALRARAERLRELVGVHAVGQQEYDDAVAAFRQAEAIVGARRAAIETARAAMETARVNLSYTPIKAPISGRIGKSEITVGALASAYQQKPLAVIQQLDPIYVDVTQATAEILNLRRRLETGRLKLHASGQTRVRLLLEDGTPYPLAGALQFRDVTVDPTTGSVSLRMVFPNPQEVLLPGMFVRAIVEEGINEHALLVPQQSVSYDPKGNPFAWIVNKENKVERRPLELDRAIGDKWLVSKGIAEEDRVIVEGVQKVRPGAQVRVTPFAAPPKGQAAPPQKAVGGGRV